MKQLTNYQRTVQYLQRIYKLVNAEYFNGELEDITLTVQESTRAYGHVTTSETWYTADGRGMKELNISANYLTRPIEEVVSTLIHEASHIYNMEHGIKDTSNGYTYHNKAFRDTAEGMGHLVVERGTYGYNRTSPSEETIDFCIRNGLQDIQIGRAPDFSRWQGFTGGASTEKPTTTKPARKPSSTRKYICPCCGNSFRATKNLNVMCMDCNEQFVLAE